MKVLIINGENGFCCLKALFIQKWKITANVLTLRLKMYMSLLVHQNRFGEMKHYSASRVHQRILCSEWVPSEWESKQLIKTSQWSGESVIMDYKLEFWPEVSNGIFLMADFLFYKHCSLHKMLTDILIVMFYQLFWTTVSNILKVFSFLNADFHS